MARNSMVTKLSALEKTLDESLKKQRDLEKKFIDNVNKLLLNSGYRKMSPSLLSDLRKKDKKFEMDIRKRRK